MGKIFLLLCMLALSFAYTDPPIAEVMGHNLDSAFLNSLMNRVPPGLVLDPEGDAVYFNATLIGVFPSVEDRIPADPSPYVHKILWTWGENYSSYIIRTVTVGNDTCTGTTLVISPEENEYEFRVLVNNISSAYYRKPPSEISAFEFPLSAAQLEAINATEKVEVRLEYEGKYKYDGYCRNYPVSVFVAVGGHSELYYYVENGNVVFFTARPVLGEQWFRNNHFDNLIFSKKKFYKTELYLDGNKTGKARIYNFSIYTDSLGTMFINTSRENNYSNATMDEFNEVYTPTPLLRENETFRYLYEENCTYEGIGYHNLTVVVTDHFLHNYTYNRSLLSRALSPEELGEATGSGVVMLAGNVSQNLTRPNYVEPPQQLNQILIPTGALAIIFIVIALAGWWGYSRGRTLD